MRTEIDYKTNLLINNDKLVDASWKIILLIGKDEKGKKYHEKSDQKFIFNFKNLFKRCK